ncbi:MAG: transcriptional regulator, LuxR family, partial [Chthonomonadales bacterium]|nr:transcriptional regulator, LuxR family [Chthonomonadales bacterium]
AEVALRMRRSRLVTLTGTGGIGKTRLALAVAEIVRTEFAQGVWFVDLTALLDPNRIVQAISAVLKLRAKPGSDLRTMLTDYLAERRMLLILDNCEQLLEGCAELAEALLEECGDLKILVTSRHPLRLAGEVDWRVPSLETPDPEHLPSGGAELVAAVRRYAATELFVECAKAAQKTFALTGENAADVARICLRLDGIPLALQLAATRIKALTAKQIAERMDDGFHLLTGGSRTIPRHQTLQATMDWSCQLLSEQERALLSRVSVFAGGWTLEAAEQVCSDLRGNAQVTPMNNQPSAFDKRPSSIAKEAVLDLLAGLVEKSLVLCEDRLEEARYRLLGTIRQYSAERLRESGQDPAVRAQHRNYFVQLAESAEPHLRGAEQQRWLDRLEAEQENLNSALEFAFSVPPASDPGDNSKDLSGARLAAALGWFWHTRGTAIEGLRWMEKALEYGGSTSSRLRILLLQRAGLLAMDQGERERAHAYFKESLERARTLDDPPGTASALLGLGNVAREQGDFEVARSLLQQSLSLFREQDDTCGTGQVLQSLAGIAANQNDYPTARRLAEDGLAIYRHLQDRQSMAVVLGNLGILARLEGDYTGAQTLYQESLELYRECKDRMGMARILGNLGNLAEDQCDSSAAYSLHEKSLSLQRALGDKQGAAISLYNLGLAAQELSDFDQAAALYRESLTLCRGLRDRLGVAYALQKLATTLAELDRPLRGISLFAAAERLRELLKAPVPPPQAPGHEIGLADMRATVGEAAFSAAWRVGASLDWEQAVAFALEEGEMGG